MEVLELPFDPIAYGWPEWNGPEYRPLLEWYVPYAWPVPCYCTYCWRCFGDKTAKEGCVVIKIVHKGKNFNELGYLETRCPKHPRTVWKHVDS